MTLQEILALTEVNKANGCRIWLGPKINGVPYIPGATTSPKRTVFRLYYDKKSNDFPDVGMNCKNKNCLEPRHMHLRTKVLPTKNEKEVLQMFSDGLTFSEISKVFCITDETVATIVKKAKSLPQISCTKQVVQLFVEAQQRKAK